MRKLYCLISCFAAIYAAADTNQVSSLIPHPSSLVTDLGTVVVEGSALSKYRPEKVTGGTFTGEPPETDLNDLLRILFSFKSSASGK